MLLRQVKLFVYFLAFSAVLFTSTAFARPNFTEKSITEVGWSVQLVKHQYESSTNTTTLFYGVTTAYWEKDLSHWVLMFNYDDFELVSITPSSPIALGLDPTTGGYGVKWDGGQAAGTYFVYTVTLRGNVEIGDIHYAVKGGTYYAIGDVQGPVGVIAAPVQLHSISGIVYVDAYMNWMYDANEPLLNNVTVTLRDDVGSAIASVPTNVNGAYLFENLPAGNYHISVDANTVMNDFNELLGKYFTLQSAAFQNVTISSTDVANINFFYGLNVTKVLAELNDGASAMALQGVGKTIGFWKHQLSVAMTGKGRPQVDAVTLKIYLDKVEMLFIAIPFQFADATAYAEANAILSSTSSVATDLLKKQLLALELNDVMGIGLLGGYEPLQDVLINWSEYLVANSAYFTRDQLIAAKDVCDTINNLGH